MSTITERAPAKINLALHVRRRRADGYHDIETLFAFAAEGDMVTLEPADRWRFTVTGPFADDLKQAPEGGFGDGADNLVTKAANAFTRAFPDAPPQHVTLAKYLPVASGIGGGSADAAATLRALARLRGVAVADPRLNAIAATLGADVPACLLGRTALGEGRGDALTTLRPLAGLPVLLVNPGVAVSTAAVFAAWDGIDRGTLVDGDPLAIAAAGRNDLEAPARTLAPVIGLVLARLAEQPGATLVRMSGSGATCFALFDSDVARDHAAYSIRTEGWWLLPTSLS